MVARSQQGWRNFGSQCGDNVLLITQPPVPVWSLLLLHELMTNLGGHSTSQLWSWASNCSTFLLAFKLHRNWGRWKRMAAMLQWRAHPSTPMIRIWTQARDLSTRVMTKSTILYSKVALSENTMQTIKQGPLCPFSCFEVRFLWCPDWYLFFN